MWNDKPDKADRSRHRHRRAGEQRGRRQNDDFAACDIDADVKRRRLAERERVQFAAVGDECCRTNEKNGNNSPLYFHPRIATLPISQEMICRNSSPVKAIMSEIKALKKAPKIMPAKMIVSTDIRRSTMRVNVKTAASVTMPHKMLTIGSVNVPSSGHASREK